jgi:TRAP-type C4-dicarboxylate transport system permease small subunit
VILFHNSLQRFLGWTVKVLEIIAGVMLVIMMALTLADVIGRYVFSAGGEING